MKTDDEPIAERSNPLDSQVMPQIVNEIDVEALLNVILDRFDPEQDIKDRFVLHEVTGLSLADLSSLDPDI